MATLATRHVRRAAHAARHSDTLAHACRVGLAGRGVFYLILTYLAAQIGVQGGGRQADANGVFLTVAAEPLGTAAIAVAVLGVLAFGVTRIAAGVGDRDVPLVRRASAMCQGGTYLVLAGFTAYFLYAAAHTNRTPAGSEQTYVHNSRQLLALPAGEALLAIVGVTVVAVCTWQIWNAVSQGYAAGIAVAQMPRRLRWLLRVTGTAGLAMRAAALVPLGVLLVWAAVTDHAASGKGLDATLHVLAAHWWGLVLLALITVGFGLFAVYSFIEAGYRRFGSGR